MSTKPRKRLDTLKQYKTESIVLIVAGITSLLFMTGSLNQFGLSLENLFGTPFSLKIQDRRSTETLMRVQSFKGGLEAHAAACRGAQDTPKTLGGLFDAAADPTQLEYALLRHVYLDDADLRQINLNFADLGHASLIQVNLGGASLRNTNFFSAGFDDATLIACDFTEANLAAAYMAGANLEGAVLTEANLRSTNLNAANLSNADCRFADFSFVRFNEHTNFSGADLRYARGLSPELIEHAKETGAILN